MERPWYRLKLTYGIIVLILCLSWFWWESYTNNRKQYVTQSITKSLQSALQSSAAEATPSTLDMMIDKGDQFYVPDYFEMGRGVYNVLHLKGQFLNELSQYQRMPLYRIESLTVGSQYVELDLNVQIRYSLFGGLTDGTMVHVTLPVPRLPFKPSH